MNRSTLKTSIVLFLTCFTSAALAQNSPSNGTNLDRVLKSGARQFEKLDLNHDGFIDQSEWNADIDMQIARLKARMAKRWVDMDIKKHNKVSREEFLADRAKWFAEVDADKTGTIDSEKIHRYNLRHSQGPDL
jgi:EF hand